MPQAFLISDFAAIRDAANVPTGAIKLDASICLFASLALAAVGYLVGAVEVLYLNRRLATRSLWTKLVAKALFYVAS